MLCVCYRVCLKYIKICKEGNGQIYFSILTNSNYVHTIHTPLPEGVGYAVAKWIRVDLKCEFGECLYQLQVTVVCGTFGIFLNCVSVVMMMMLNNYDSEDDIGWLLICVSVLAGALGGRWGRCCIIGGGVARPLFAD